MSKLTLAAAERVFDGAAQKAAELDLNPMSVAVTGDLPDNDEAVAIAGIEAAGLEYDTGE